MVQMKRFIKILGFQGKILLCAVVLLFLGTGCRRGNDMPDEHRQLEDFIEKDAVGLFGYGGFLFKYSEEECQLAVNHKRKQMRLQNDNQMDYVHIKFAKFPDASSVTLNVEVWYKVGKDEIHSVSQMETVKTGNGKIWLWDMEKKAGLILPVWW